MHDLEGRLDAYEGSPRNTIREKITGLHKGWFGSFMILSNT
jgi:hypothetical protein